MPYCPALLSLLCYALLLLYFGQFINNDNIDNNDENVKISSKRCCILCIWSESYYFASKNIQSNDKMR